jgi:hypothetical protein
MYIHLKMDGKNFIPRMGGNFCRCYHFDKIGCAGQAVFILNVSSLAKCIL